MNCLHASRRLVRINSAWSLLRINKAQIFNHIHVSTHHFVRPFASSVVPACSISEWKSGTFIERHIGPRDKDKQHMLNTIGFQNMEQMISATIPNTIRIRQDLNLGPALTESELVQKLRDLASDNKPEWRSYIGIGYYNCITPPVIMRNVFENPGWYTQYTPYQAEIAQGRLESLLNFQTLISDLTALPVANASLLDEGTAAAEAMQMTYRIHKGKRNKFLISKHIHPQTLSVVQTRADVLGIQVEQFDETDIQGLDKLKSQDYCGLIVQYPNSEGLVIDLNEINQICSQSGISIVVASDLLALTMLKAPGEYSAVQVAIGSAQRFGIPLNFGGPHAAFMATKEALTRMMPGRVVGITKDMDGNQALRLALQTREQHIRRDKATSNICTAQALLANMSAMYAVYHGPDGLLNIAQKVHQDTAYLANQLLANDISVVHKLFFDTIKVKPENIDQVRQRAQENKINLRYYDDGQHVGVSLDETVTAKDVQDILYVFGATLKQDLASKTQNIQQSPVKRTSSYLTHPVFNTYKSETQLLRYMKQLENKDLSLAHSMIPLGSCTMKLNGTSEMVACSWPEFSNLHPFVPADQSAGYAKLLQQLEHDLCEITGYNAVSFQPNSGAQGEYAGLRVIKAYLESTGQTNRDICLIPISAHGTNPASAHMAGFKVQVVNVNKEGRIDLDDLETKLAKFGSKVGCLMVTYPSTYGVYEDTIERVCQLVHEVGGQVYLDGANMNAQLGLCRPGDYGSDVSHLNLHKTFCIPHGGGGPGMGPIAVKSHLAPFLPTHPMVYSDQKKKSSFGSVSAAPWGSAAILPISWSYIRLMGGKGLKHSSEMAILNANYMAKRLSDSYKILYRGKNGMVAHEFILDTRDLKNTSGVEAMDIAKRLQDYGFHAPTVSFPVANTLMVEPTESEDLVQLDQFCDALISIRSEIAKIESGHWDQQLNPLKQAPHTQRLVCSDQWNLPYTRTEAAYPAAFVKPETKIWPTVRRTDDAFGDTNLFCTCPPLTN